MPVRLLRIAGVITVLFALGHVGFWWAFDWSTDLDPLTETNKGVMLALDVASIYVLLSFAVLLLWRPKDLVGTASGRLICWLIAGFWIVRGIDEFFVFADPNPVLALIVILVGALHVTALVLTRPARTAG